MTLNDKAIRKTAYLWGKIFAVAEKTEIRINNYTDCSDTQPIRRKLTLSCEYPERHFPLVVRAAMSNLSKLERYNYDESEALNYRLSELINEFTIGDENVHPLPKHLGIEQQGEFWAGYYMEMRD